MKNLITALCLLLCMACSQPENEATVSLMTVAEPEKPAQKSPAEPKSGVRKLIKDGSIRFQTNDAETTRKRIVAAAAARGGYVASDKQQKSTDEITYTMDVRVPARQFDAFLALATKDVSHFDYKNIQVKDVTAEYLDQEARLRTKKGIEARYLQLLNTAAKVADILSIEKELGTVRTEIEAAEGQLKYLTDQVQYSSIHISFYTENAAPALFAHQLGRALVEGWEGFQWFLLKIVTLWPFVVIISLMWFLVKRMRIRNRAK